MSVCQHFLNTAMCYCLQKIGCLLCREVEVEEFVVDFEKAMWKALCYVFGEDAKIYGCAFHWGQAVWPQVQVYYFSMCFLVIYIYLY